MACHPVILSPLPPLTIIATMSLVAGEIDSRIAIVTPENIAFEYRLAGPFRRLPAPYFERYSAAARGTRAIS